MDFGTSVHEHSRRLSEQGLDANQIAKVLCDRDDDGYNYGIGIILGGDGKPAQTSPTLLSYAAAELKASGDGTYYNTSSLLDQVKRAVLAWQRVPEAHWDDFILALPSDAGSGAVMSAIQASLLLAPSLRGLTAEELGWPAYRSMARVCRVGYSEIPEVGIVEDDATLAVYQAGPSNTTGRVRSLELLRQRAAAAAAAGTPIVLDRAYSGFEFARDLEADGYDAVMRRSYELQIAPFVEAGTRFSLAVSPTKAFVTFSLRPAGFLLVHEPDAARRKEAANVVGAVLRSRGSAFEHPITRAFARAMVNDRAALEAEHGAAMQRMAEAEALWRSLVEGTPIEYLYSDEYAGLFRNPPARDGAEARIYDEHIYPVFSSGRCRQNVTGIPSDRELARRHVDVFARECH